MIKISNLYCEDYHGVEVLKDISFELGANTNLGVIGPNGAGKTTLLLCMAGLIAYKGDIVVFGEQALKKNWKELRKRFSFVFQNPDDQLFMPTVFENVAFGLDKLGFSKEEIRDKVISALKAVYLSGFEDKSAHHLSFGEKKKVCLAIAFARNSELLLLDEPTSELDPGSRREFAELIREFPATKIIVCHDMDLVKEVCEKTMVINDGKIVAIGETEELLGNTKLMRSNRLL
jgi:cobalt/nickel transport system ATP-binding protein